MKVNLGDIINYSLKHECTTEFYDLKTGEITPVEWETRWLGDYYSWLYGWSRGFQSTRISVNPRKIKKKNKTFFISRPDDLNDHNNRGGPMPFMCSFSVFDTDYYYW